MQSKLLLPIAAFLAMTTSGCGKHFLQATGPAPGPVAMLENPTLIPVGTDREFVWHQIVDTVDDYFRIRREQRVQHSRHVSTEGMIETFPQIGATIFEPWRRDSTAGRERWHATLQTIRRRATVRVIPQDGVYAVEVQVMKEIEDLSQPQHSGVGRATQRHDGSMVRLDPKGHLGPAALGWYVIGRDTSLEQEILQHIQARVHKSLPKPRPYP